jgi:AcrR family transcriptional regulator
MSRISALSEAYLRKAPRQSRSRSVVEAILGGASDLLDGERNEDDVTVQEVADRAGVGIGSLYDYFRDRRSLLAAFAAKATEDNRLAFEKVLAGTDALPLEEGVRCIMDFCFAQFTEKKRAPRAVMRIAYAVGLMPTVAQSTDVAAVSLANALRRRKDVHVTDCDVAAWTMTHTMMGIVHTLVWMDEPSYSSETLRAELITLYSGYLGGARHPRPPA